MKKFLLSVMLLMAGTAAVRAQDVQSAATAAAEAFSAAPQAAPQVQKVQYWSESVKSNITFGQTGLHNWAAGGDNTTTLAAYVDANENYKRTVSVNGKDKDMYWNNRLQLDFGFLYASSKPILQKSSDRIYFESKWGYELGHKFYLSANYDFKSQFANGYTYNTPSGVEPEGKNGGYSSRQWREAAVQQSGFLSPAYTNIAVGLDWKPASWFSATLSPLTGGVVISTAPQFRQDYSMALKCAEDDPDYLAALESGDEKAIGKFYYPARFELGAQLKVDGKFTINEVFSYTTQLVLFSSYLDDPKNLRVNWDNRIDWKLAKYFSLTVVTNLIKDPMVFMTNDAGERVRRGIQFKEAIQFGFTYTFERTH